MRIFPWSLVLLSPPPPSSTSTVVRRPHFFRARWATLFLFSHWLEWLLFTLKIKIIIESHNWINFDQRTRKQKQEKKYIIRKKDFNLKRFRLIDLRQLFSVTANKVNSRRSHNIYQFPNWKSLLQRRFIVKTNVIINSGRQTHPNWYAESLIPKKNVITSILDGNCYKTFACVNHRISVRNITKMYIKAIQAQTIDGTVVDSIWNGPLDTQQHLNGYFRKSHHHPNGSEFELVSNKNRTSSAHKFLLLSRWPKKWTKHTQGNMWIGLVNRSLSCKYMLLVSILSQKLFLRHIFTL